MNLSQKIEAILFFKGEPVSISKLAEFTNSTKDEIEVAIKEVEKNLIGHGIVLIQKDKEVMLGTMPEASEIIEKITKEELIKDIGKAGLETLSIILYKAPITRREIDYIRGVNSNFILRNLLIRGLVERVDSEEGGRAFSYQPTFDLLSLLGISKIEELPEYKNIIESINKFKEDNKEEEN